MKNPFHKSEGDRNWQLVSRSYAPPAKQVPSTITDPTILERAIFGVTTLVFQDENTGEVKKEEMLGSDENQLYTMLEKVSNLGMQEIVYGGKKFAIAQIPMEEVLTE